MIYFLITIISLLIGVYLGSKTDRTLFEDDAVKIVERMGKTIKQVFKDKSDLKPGVIRRPDAQALYQQNKPEIERQADKAMNESLGQIPELANAKQYVKEHPEVLGKEE